MATTIPRIPNVQGSPMIMTPDSSQGNNTVITSMVNAGTPFVNSSSTYFTQGSPMIMSSTPLALENSVRSNGFNNSTNPIPPRTPIRPNVVNQVNMDESVTAPPTLNITGSSPIKSKLTIYSKSGHIVQRFGPGSRLITLPKSVEIASIVVLDSAGQIVPFSYIPETTMGVALTDRSTGEKVQASVTKEGETINGKILSLDSDNVMLMTGNQITNIREYDRVTVNINEDLTRPRLVLGRASKPVTLSYLLSSIAWTCVGTVLVDNNNDMMYLRLAGNISNNTESDIQAETILVSGEVYQYRGRQETYAENVMYAAAPQVLARAPAPMSSKKVQTAMLEDYVKYEVGDRMIRTQDIAELGTWSFPVIKLYVHQTNDNDKVRFGYRFTAPGFIPSCSLNVYSIDIDKNIDAYLGSNEIEESQKAAEVDIMLGESTMLQCKSSIIISNDVVIEDEATLQKLKLPAENIIFGGQSQQQQHVKGSRYIDDRRWHLVTEDLKVEISNYNTKPASLVLKHYVGNKFLVDTRCQSYKKRENGFLEWYFQVPPRTSPEPKKERFACQIVTATYY